ncbi:MAG: hypothetical protein MUP17_04470 [candidate division Zixibacteria bacterium]|nr:hypothetical protein [candidate division Zixibacteria bacterium]
MTLYKNQYRIESTRLKEWVYSRYGYYFVTICTKDKQYFFGDIVADKMQLSEIGKIVAGEWGKTDSIRDYAKLDECVIMLNHLHGIVIIQNENNVETHSMRLYEKIIYQISFVDSNLPRSKKLTKKVLRILPGNPDFMTTLSAMKKSYMTFGNILFIIP